MQLTTNKGFAPATITEAIQFSEMLAKSAMVPKQYQGKPEDIMVAVQWGYEIGLAPLQALQNISVINGKPSVYGDAAMALVQASAVCEGVDEHFENEGTPNPVAVCIARRRGRNPVIARFSVDDAKKAGLWGKVGPWQAYPKRMMQMRARGFALRDAFPDVLKGLITAEEAQDYPSERDVTPKAKPVMANPLDALAPPAPAIKAPVAVAVDMIEREVAIEADPQQEYVEVEQVNEQLQELEKQAAEAGLEVVEIQEVAQSQLGEELKAELEKAGIESEVVEQGFVLRVPKKEKPVSVHPTLADWAAAYDSIADKTARAAKAKPRDRMSALKALREVNEEIIKQISPIDRVKLTANYQKRLAALGAAMSPEERAEA